MSYAVTWTEGTKERLRTALPKVKPTDRREWLLGKVTEHVQREIATYPQDGRSQPGQRVAGKLHVAGFCVSYEIHMDAHSAIVTEVKS
jgi:hypothetical protein